MRIHPLLLLLLLLPVSVFAAGEKWKIEKEGVPWMQIKSITPEGWKVEVAGTTLKLKPDSNGWKGKTDKETFKVAVKEDKLKVRRQGEDTFLEVKLKGEKIKIYQGDPFPWVLKRDAERTRIKVMHGEEVVGKVHLYPGKIKVKDMSGVERCTLKAARLLTAAAVCLMDGFSPDELALVAALLMLAP